MFLRIFRRSGLATIIRFCVGLCVVVWLVQAATGIPADADRVPQGSGGTVVPFAVGLARCTFVDPTRDVLRYDTFPPSTLSHVRTLVTEIRYPTRVRSGTAEFVGALPIPSSTGYPMIVFAHGYDVRPDVYAPLLDAWVRAGFVVVAPIFPDENPAEVVNQHGVNTENDLVNEPADITFVTRQILHNSRASVSRCPIVEGLIRDTEIGLAGHSDGATVVGMLTYANGRDPEGVSYQALRSGLHYRSAVILAGQEDGVDSYASHITPPPLLVVQSDADQCLAPSNAIMFYRDIHESDKWFLELRTAHHLPPFDGIDVAAFDVVRSISTRFFVETLTGASLNSGLLASQVTKPGVARIVHAGNGPRDPVVRTPSIPCGPN
jgi:hypothetical protein